MVHLPRRLAIALEAGSDILPNLTLLEVRHRCINSREEITSHYHWIGGVYLRKVHSELYGVMAMMG